ncbi:hypothetical protein BU16DRAFT_522417 [Lophium mytilinum]|uniref:Uncharacterized protein n=1 Tax=Lophium mytilinum TaxID=390894 RepID=A0A6A6RCI3_9PEZI|nr:hypothetical protein BU16DRAFT_522417 [Lophium mytilinum]
MASKFFTWTKGDRRAAAEAHRTGGLLPLATDFPDAHNNSSFATSSSQNAHARPQLQGLLSPSSCDAHGQCLAPASALHNAALSSVSSASNLLAVVNEMLRSPALTGSACPRSPLHKPLPGRPRSISLPPTPDIVELPGSLLLVNQGFPPASPVAASAASQTMRSVRSANLLSPTLAEYRAPAAPRDSRAGIPQHKKSLSEARVQRRSKSRPSLLLSPSSTTESKLTACSASTNGGQSSSNDSARARAGSDSSRSLQPSPMILEKRNGKQKMSNQGPSRHDEMSSNSSQLEELKATISAQDQTISTLSSQFASLQTSHEAHIASLSEAHEREISSLKTYARVLEEQSQQRSLHHASSNHLLMLLDTAEPQTPTAERPANPQIVPSATSIRSFQTALEEQPQLTPRATDPTADMRRLTRTLSSARRPKAQDDAPDYDETLKQNAELTIQNQQYKLNESALHRQIDRFMDKLKAANSDVRDLQKTVSTQKEHIDSLELEARVRDVDVDTSVKPALEDVKKLRNSVDYLETRLQVSNVARVDALEQIYNLKHDVNPFNRPQPSEKQLTIDLQEACIKIQVLENQLQRTGRYYENDVTTPSRSGSGTAIVPVQARENTPLKEPVKEDPSQAKVIAAFVDKLERQNCDIEVLNKQIREKDAVINDHQREYRRVNEAATGRYAVAEARLEEMEKRSEALEKRCDSWEGESNHWERKYNRSTAELKELTSKLDDAEIHILRLRREMEYFKRVLESEIRKRASFEIWAEVNDNRPLPQNATREDVDRMIALLQKRLKAHIAHTSGKVDNQLAEHEFRIEQLSKEVEFYVREIIYYKLDIKGYKKDIKNLSSALSLPSEASSPIGVGHRDIPVRAKFALASPRLGISATPSPTSIPMSASSSLQPATPATSAALSSPQASPAGKHVSSSLNKKLPPSPSEIMPPQTPERSSRRPSQTSPGPSPRTALRISHSQDTAVGTGVQNTLANPIALQREDTQRSASDSIITMYATARTPDWSPPRTTPERPVRPRHGLLEFVPKTDVLAAAEAEKQKEVDTGAGKAPMRGHGRSMSYSTAPLAPPQQRKRSGSGSGSVGANEGSSIPFVIGMGSPHNPALFSGPGAGMGDGEPF